jgi:hypothetical protein
MGERFRTHRRSDRQKSKAQLEIEYLMTKRRQDGRRTLATRNSGRTTMETTSTSSIHTAMPTLKGKRVFITGARPGAGAPSLIFSDQ